MIAALNVGRSGALYLWNGVELRSVFMCITSSESPNLLHIQNHSEA